MDNLFRLDGQVAIVTGGNGGIGKAIARAFASVGADVVIAARNEAKTKAAVSEITEEFGIRALGVTLDVRDQKRVSSAVTKTLETFGRIDILVNNAGIGIRKMPQDFTLEDWDNVLNTNLRGAFLMSQAVYPAMKAAGRGKIINIGSLTSTMGATMQAPYGSSKGGIVQLTRCLAVAWGKDNIQVNAILPGIIRTDLYEAGRKVIPGLEASVLVRTPAGRLGEPEDLAGAAIFLASRASDFVTGASLPVDGGYVIMWV